MRRKEIRQNKKREIRRNGEIEGKQRLCCKRFAKGARCLRSLFYERTLAFIHFSSHDFWLKMFHFLRLPLLLLLTQFRIVADKNLVNLNRIVPKSLNCK